MGTDHHFLRPSVTSPGKWWSVPVFAVGWLLAVFVSATPAQPFAERTVVLDGETLHYSIRPFSPGANLIDPAAPLKPTSALHTAKLLNQHLIAGEIEDAALLSNAPRRRFDVLREYKLSVGDDGFKQVFTEYFYPENRVVAEVAIGEHSLLVWHLRGNDRYAGQYYVQVEGKVLMDDVPSETRSRLRRVLEAIRTGKMPLPVQ